MNMTEEQNNLVLERLRIMRQESSVRFDQLSSKVDTLTAEIASATHMLLD
jgi:hypothetical protein